MLDKVRNVDIRSRLGQVAVVARVENKKTEWLKKMEEMTELKRCIWRMCHKATEGKTKEKMVDDLKVN